MRNPIYLLAAILGAATLWLPASSAAAQCSVTGHESALFDLTDPILDLADATVRAEDAYAQLVQNADPDADHTSVVVEDLKRLIDDLFAAGSKLDRNNLDHLHGQERAEREVMDLCIDDHYRAKRVASSCTNELRDYRRVIRSLAILTEDLVFVIGNAQSAGADITSNASTLWPTTEARTDVRNEDLDRMDRLIREAKTIRSQLEGEVRAERHPRRALYDCIRQTPEYYESFGGDREDGRNTPSAVRENIRSMQQVLADCGFPPGPADGLWGDRTERAATSFIRAHGGEPAYGDRGRLAEQVVSYLTGETGPCPSETATAFTKEQLDYGCWQTEPECLKASKPRLRDYIDPNDRYRSEITEISSRLANQCGGPVFVKVLFEMSDGDTRYYNSRFMRDKEQWIVLDTSDSKRQILTIEGNLRGTGVSPPWGDGPTPGWFTGQMAYAWVGIPKDQPFPPEEKLWLGSPCETEGFKVDNLSRF
ncbi:MAG: peptidoglycan-binding domain-containing protein [Rhodospirillales bacterium]|nr:peptidoglycan-binding domain-containing protein [Rhodospirillales bacterium]